MTSSQPPKPNAGAAMPEGFVQVPDNTADEAELPKILEAERWRGGAQVVYNGLVTWKGGRGETFRAHSVRGVNDESRTPYGVWATAVLDRLLEHVPAGEVIFLRYDGLQPHPAMPDRSLHKWTVGRSKTAPKPAPAEEVKGLPF